ncbi:hypothetical protein [Ralstonia sp. A12]|uniref:hypothetical protein n=1 Tax=Ralstonia sp. A12 TaxID=1217052 RepID=UPI0018DBA3E6|nr:hypothetical protein [Ralstonia sp. A12]
MRTIDHTQRDGTLPAWFRFRHDQSVEFLQAKTELVATSIRSATAFDMIKIFADFLLSTNEIKCHSLKEKLYRLLIVELCARR